MPTSVEEFYALLGRRVQEARKKFGITQQTLGGMLVPTVSRTSIANIETGKQGVLAFTLAQLADALCTQPAELIPPIPVAADSTAWKAELADKLPPEVSERLQERLSRLPTTGVKHGRPSRSKRR